MKVNWGPANVLSAFMTPQMISSPMGPGGTLLFFGCVCLIVMPGGWTACCWSGWGKKEETTDLIVELWLGVILFYYMGSMIFGFK
jgi:hypothetical protein